MFVFVWFFLFINGLDFKERKKENLHFLWASDKEQPGVKLVTVKVLDPDDFYCH